MKAFATLAGLVAAASALSITQPTDQAKWDLSSTNSIIWSYVSSDPTKFDLYLIDNGATPPSSKLIKNDVSTADGKYDLDNFVAAPGAKYIIQAQSNEPNNTGILASSQTFNVTKSGVAPSTTSAAPTASKTGGGRGGAEPTGSKTGAAAGVTFSVAAPLAALLAFFL